MNDFAHIAGMVLALAGLGATYLSRFMLRDVQKETGEELQDRVPQLSRIRQRYSLQKIITLAAAGAVLVLLYLLDPDFWKKRVLLLFAPLLVAHALNDAFFALRTNVFPTSRKHVSNSYFYDSKGYYHSVAYWQIAAASAVFLADCLIIFSELMEPI